MKSYLISDNKDTWLGMRLAGIEGTIISNRDEALEALNSVVKNKEVGLVILTEGAVDLIKEEVMELKCNFKTPLLIEIPSRRGTTRGSSQITNYIKDSVGIRI